MNINFTYAEGRGSFDHVLKLVTIDGADIEIGFDGMDASHIYVSGHEMSVKSDDYKGLYVNVGRAPLSPRIITLASLIRRAEDDLEDIIGSCAAESKEWAAHIRSLTHQDRYI